MFWPWRRRRIPADTGTTMYMVLCVLSRDAVSDFEGETVLAMEGSKNDRLAKPLICTDVDPAGAEAVARRCVAHDFPHAEVTEVLIREAPRPFVEREFRRYREACLQEGHTCHWPMLVAFGPSPADVDNAFELAF